MSGQANEPIGTVRRDPLHGALAVCIPAGYRVMLTDNDQVLVLSPASASDPEWLDVCEWPIIWCPNAAYHEQDNIRRAGGIVMTERPA